MKRIGTYLLMVLLWSCGGSGSSIDEDSNGIVSRFGGFQVKDSVDLELWSDPSEQMIGNDICTVLLGMKNQKLWVGVFDENKMEKFSWSSKDDFDPNRILNMGYGHIEEFSIAYFRLEYCNITDSKHFQIAVSSLNANPHDPYARFWGVYDLFFVNDDVENIYTIKANSAEKMHSFKQWYDDGIAVNNDMIFDKNGCEKICQTSVFQNSYISYVTCDEALFYPMYVRLLNDNVKCIVRYNIQNSSLIWGTELDISTNPDDILVLETCEKNSSIWTLKFKVIQSTGEYRISEIKVNIETGEIV